MGRGEGGGMLLPLKLLQNVCEAARSDEKIYEARHVDFNIGGTD